MTFLKATVLAVAGSMSAVVFAADITGAGATFPYPIYAKWADAYKAKTGVGLNYQAIGSGGGIKQIIAKTVDFGASDMPMTLEDQNKNGLTMFPAIVGGVVPVTNLDGISGGQLHLSGEVLADIYLGKVKNWDDKAIAALNPGVKLPDQNIVVVRRSDGSGTSFIFTNYLSKVSEEWKTKVGAGTAVNWPDGVGGKGNEGVASYVQRIKGAIGYVEFAYAKKAKMDYIAMKNKDGQIVQPDDATFQAAAAYADWSKAPGFYEVLTNEPGKNSWPITGVSFILMQKVQDKPENGLQVLKFYDWALKNGAAAARELDYVPLPATLIKHIQDSWSANIKDAAGKPVWK